MEKHVFEYPGKYAYFEMPLRIQLRITCCVTWNVINSVQRDTIAGY